MANIPPIGDAYIDEIIKAIDPYDSTLNKTQGIKLRELIKLMRDRTEQQIALSVAQQQSYTEVGDTNISVSPVDYFDQPTAFIVNRNAGSDAIISFESYAATDDTGKIYHIKNMGSIAAVLVSASEALFDGETSITLSQYSAVTIMSVNLTIDGGTLSKWAIMSNNGQATDQVNRVLTLNVVGLPGNIAVSVNGTIWPGRQKSFPVGTVLQNLVVTAAGYTISPSSIPSVTIDEDKTLNFTATATGDDPFLTIVVNGIADGYEVAVNNVVWIDNKKAFPIGTVLENLRVRVEDYDITPAVIEQVVMDSNKTLEFDGINQGFSHIDSQWEAINGGGYQSNITRIGNTLTSSSRDTNNTAFAGFTLSGTEAGSLKLIMHEGMFGVWKEGETVAGQNSCAYGVITEGTLVKALAWLGGTGGDDVFINVPNSTHPILIEIEFTSTEVIWYYSEDRIEWARTPRQVFNYYVGAAVFTEVKNIKQKGFTATEEPATEPLPGNSFVTINAEAYNDPVVNILNVWSIEDYEFGAYAQPNRRLAADSIFTFQYQLDSEGLQVEVKNDPDWFSQYSLQVSIDSDGIVIVDTNNSTPENLPTQPTVGQYICIQFLEEDLPDNKAKFRVGILDEDGDEVYGKDYFPVYVSFEENIIQINLAQTTKLYYPQGANLVSVTPENLLSGFTYMTLPAIYYEEVEPNIWNQLIGSSGAIYLDFIFDFDGAIFFRFFNNGFNFNPEYDLRTSETGGSELYFYIDNGLIKSESSTGEYYTEPAVDGTFYGLIRESGNIKSVKTTDGITFTTMYDFGDKSTYKYLGSWRYASQTNKIYYPQVKGLVADGILPDFEYFDIKEEQLLVFGDGQLINANNSWTTSGTDPRARAKPSLKLDIDSSLAYLYNELLSGFSLELKTGTDWYSNNRFQLFIDQYDPLGLVRVNCIDGVDEELPLQPTIGQYLAITMVSETGSDSVIRVSILSNIGVEVYGKNYDVTYLNATSNRIQFNFNTGDIVLRYPQGKNLINVPPINGLLSGNQFLNLSTKEGTTVVENDHVWSLIGTGSARAGVGKRFVAGSSVAFLYTPQSAYTNLYLRINNSRDGVKIEIDGSGNVHVIFWDGLDEDLPQQPITGEYVQLTKISDSPAENDPATFRIDILDGNGITVWNKVYTARYVASEETEIDFVFNVSDGYLSYPQGKNLINI